MRGPTVAKGVMRAKTRPPGTTPDTPTVATTPCPTTKKRLWMNTPGEPRTANPLAALRKDELIRLLMEVRNDNEVLSKQLNETREQVTALQEDLRATTQRVAEMAENNSLIKTVQTKEHYVEQTEVNNKVQTNEDNPSGPQETTDTPALMNSAQPLTYRTWADVIRGATPAKRRLLREVLPAPRQDLTTIVVTGVTGRISAIKGLLTESGLRKPFPINIETLHDNTTLMSFPTSMEDEFLKAADTGLIGHQRIPVQEANKVAHLNWTPQLKKAIGARLSKRVAEFWYRRPMLHTQITQWMEALELPILSNEEMIEHARMARYKKNTHTRKSPRALPPRDAEPQLTPCSPKPVDKIGGLATTAPQTTQPGTPLPAIEEPDKVASPLDISMVTEPHLEKPSRSLMNSRNDNTQ
ncbi:hypothetical protein IWQ62_006028 [Dispira parvispora]|uniref:Uncharacterized protein n=1 Tax=Dispira parvispora TaxID=1520584 RepID=A0A9W8E4P7_9FUNG|nr:hypothetical protein IWQ62_006028 [Dispira parvispora]